jgi:AraC-like DNA-binding protein
MPRPRKEPPSPSSIAPTLVAHARSRGLDVDVLLCRFGLPADAEDREEVLVAPGDPEEIFDWVARACGEPDLALRLGAGGKARRYGFGELAARASPTLREALTVLARYAPMLHVDFAASVEEGEGAPRFVLRTPRRPRGVGRHVHEFALAHALAQCREGCPVDVVATRAWFAHARPRELDPIHAFFGTRDLAFGCPDSGIAFDAGLLDTPMRGVDPRMRATVEPLAEAALRARIGLTTSASLAARVAARLASTLADGADVADVAGALHMSARTLQRRLEEEGTRFSEVLDRVRLDLAREALGDPAVTLTDVAFRLGFVDLATFSRAFKRWTGKPPGQWRHG